MSATGAVRAWAILGSVAFANLVVAALHFGLAAAGPAVRTSLDLSTGSLGAVLAAPALGLMLGTYAWGLLADRTSERRVLAGAFVGFTVATLLAAERAGHADATGFGLALIASGVFGSAAHSAGGRVISSAFPPERHGFVLSIRHVAIPIGGAVGGIAVPLLVERHGLGAATLVAALLGATAAVVVAIVIPSSRGPRALHRSARSSSGPSPLRIRAMWLLATGAGSLAFVQLGIGAFLTVQLVDRAQVHLAVAAAVFTGAQLLGAGGRVVLGIWSDRVADRVVMLQAVAAVTLGLVVAGTLSRDPLVAVLLQSLALVVVTSCNGVVVAVAASLAPSGRTGATLGMQTTANALACSVAPILLGGVVAYAGWIAFGPTLIVVLGVGSWSLAVLRRTDRRQLAAGISELASARRMT